MKKILAAPFSLVIVISFALGGCATKPVKFLSAPSFARMESLKKAHQANAKLELSSPSEELAEDYLEALYEEEKGQLKAACDHFEKLADHESFPAKDAALLHAMNVCRYSAEDLKDLWAKTTVRDYMQEFYFETSLRLAATHKLDDYEAEFAFALIPFKQVQSEKIKLINRAMAIAEKRQDAEKLKLYKEKLIELSPMYAEQVTPQNIYAVARDFESNRHFDKARELYQSIIKGDFPLELKIKAFNAYRTSFKVARDLKTFLAKTFEMEEFLKEEREKNPEEKIIQAWADAKIALARAVWTEHRNSEAREILDELIQSQKGSVNQQAQAQYLYGALQLENKENKEALKRFEKAASFKITDSALIENVQWAVVWNSWLLKDDQKVQKAVDQFTKKSLNPAFVNRLTYWKAKSLQRTGKKEEAETIFNTLTTLDPFGYYGILAHVELNKPLSPLSPSVISTDAVNNLELDWLIGLGEKEYAQKILKKIDSQFKTPEDRERAMSIYFLTEWYQRGMRQIYNFKQSVRNQMTEKYINVVFPSPYQETVATLSKKYDVPEELIYAITRQESAFVPSERSWADAFGLMQMIPEKAQELSKKYKIPYKDFSDLYNPVINLEMGTALLHELKKKTNSKFAQTVAAYNASEAAFKVWEKERYNGNYLEFIEMIPYEETRNYIKLVFRNYITYKRITSKKDFVLNKDFFTKPFH